MKNRRIYLIVLYCLYSAISCSVRPEATNSTIPCMVTVIFKNAPPQSFTNRFGGHSGTIPESTVQYVDTTGIRVYYVPRSIGYDTISIPAYNGYAELSHRNQAIDEIYYLLKAGDTVLFTYGKNLRPQLVSLISKRNTTLYNLPFKDAHAVQPVGWSTHAMLNNYRRQSVFNLDSLATVYKDYVAHFSVLLDTMEANHTIPQTYIDYYRQQLSNQITRKFGFYERSSEYLPYMTDSLMHYISYYRQAMSYKGSMPIGERFDTIATDTLLQPLAKKAILHFLIEQIESDCYGLQAYHPKFKQSYGEKYIQLTGDTTFHHQVISARNILTEGYSNDLILQSLNGQQHSYHDILTKHVGKVIYVDLWASWCGPCRAGMPDAKLLREAYKDKDVVFLYLAINDMEAAWHDAVKKLRIDYLGENYRVLNTQESQFLKEIKNTHIPHFLLYNRFGSLVNWNAPSPHGNGIREQLDRLLKE